MTIENLKKLTIENWKNGQNWKLDKIEKFDKCREKNKIDL